MKREKTKMNTNNRRPTASQLKELGFISAVLVVIAALIGVYIAWMELFTPGQAEILII
ncbi:hypothetical protein [Paenibacillus faecalis]|uniref:hypothetical protein n=1 Tax=Paenibacillus faecalis TaxID=2079532 RepID=UPI00131A5E56|nr:hypothetical protein [Paenibacillus faecalis]